MAYHAADRERWMGLDFVIGIEVKLSSNHTVEGKDGRLVRLTDICDELAGKYPKDFHFTGWHPHCRCVAVPILRKPGEASGGEVTELPEGFRKWVEGHEDKIAGWREKGNEPYFLRENRGRVDGVLKGTGDGEDASHQLATGGAREIVKPVSKNPGEVVASMKKQKRIAKVPLLEEYAKRRDEIRELMKSYPKEYYSSLFDSPLKLYNKSVKEWLNQPHRHYAAKNEALLNLQSTIEGCTEVRLIKIKDKHSKSVKQAYALPIEIENSPSWIIIHRMEWGEIKIYGISDNLKME